MEIRTKGAVLVSAGVAAVLALSGCSDSGTSGGSGDTGGTSLAGAPSWCGTKKVTFAQLDGFGGNSWRQVTTASGEEEAKKCPSVTQYEYADGQGNTQKAISDINGMVAKGIGAMVVFGDAGPAVLPALGSGHKAGVPLLRSPRPIRPPAPPPPHQGRCHGCAVPGGCRRQGRHGLHPVRWRVVRR
jgi:ribose transport system substrate-binding protein